MKPFIKTKQLKKCTSQTYNCCYPKAALQNKWKTDNPPQKKHIVVITPDCDSCLTPAQTLDTHSSLLPHCSRTRIFNTVWFRYPKLHSTGDKTENSHLLSGTPTLPDPFTPETSSLFFVVRFKAVSSPAVGSPCSQNSHTHQLLNFRSFLLLNIVSSPAMGSPCSWNSWNFTSFVLLKPSVPELQEALAAETHRHINFISFVLLVSSHQLPSCMELFRAAGSVISEHKEVYILNTSKLFQLSFTPSSDNTISSHTTESYIIQLGNGHEPKMMAYPLRHAHQWWPNPKSELGQQRTFEDRLRSRDESWLVTLWNSCTHVLVCQHACHLYRNTTLCRTDQHKSPVWLAVENAPRR